ncbi:MAG: hypothetical protein AAF378_25185 [Cyanobacteria bacterium P01_A01_bin.84]
MLEARWAIASRRTRAIASQSRHSEDLKSSLCAMTQGVIIAKNDKTLT